MRCFQGRQSECREGGAIMDATQADKGSTMCRNIKTLFNFAPPATEDEIRAAALQFVRKLSGFNAPSKANTAAFERAVDEVAAAAGPLIGALVTSADPREREAEALRARARNAVRFAPRERGPVL
jgi:hypothetical protein